jgi:regulatory protein YycI of two-component signal transduction system YycFG
MDWSRAKTILIVIFFILNLFLTAIIITEDINSDYKITKKDVLTYFNSRNITINKDLLENIDKIKPTKEVEVLLTFNKSIDYINKTRFSKAEEIILDIKNNIIYQTKEPEVFFSNANKDREMNEFFERFRINFSEYRYLDKRSNIKGSIWDFVGTYQGIYLYDDELKIETENNYLVKFLKNNVEIIKGITLSEIPGEIERFSIWHVLLRHYTESTEIVNIDYGLKSFKTQEDLDELTAVIAWRIQERNGITRYFKISNAEEIEEN